jgi:hypothetical protein
MVDGNNIQTITGHVYASRLSPPPCEIPVRATHVVEVKTSTLFVEITEKCKISQLTMIDPPPLVPYTSNIGNCIRALPRHVQRLVGDIPELRTPAGWDSTTPVDIIIATDGSATLGVGYHSWVVAMEDEDMLLQGGGSDDGDLFLMQSYRSELGVWQQVSQSLELSAGQAFSR